MRVFSWGVFKDPMRPTLETTERERIGNGTQPSWSNIHPGGKAGEHTIQLDHEPFSGKGRGARRLNGAQSPLSTWLKEGRNGRTLPDYPGGWDNEDRPGDKRGS